MDKGILSGLIVVTRMHLDDFSLSILAYSLNVKHSY